MYSKLVIPHNNFDFNKTLNALLEGTTDSNVKGEENSDTKIQGKIQGEVKRKKSFNVMETLSNIFNQKNSETESYDYHKLD